MWYGPCSPASSPLLLSLFAVKDQRAFFICCVPSYPPAVLSLSLPLFALLTPTHVYISAQASPL